LLSACALPELICGNLEEYRSRALKLARSPELLLGLRKRLQQCKASAPAFDTPRYTRDLEDLLLEIHATREQRIG
jgi:predicted O-linked N-acetylglucosamine transferase (SPINDLY family)